MDHRKWPEEILANHRPACTCRCRSILDLLRNRVAIVMIGVGSGWVSDFELIVVA